MTDFLQRLKQRKLVQWAVAYVAFAFALIQVLDVVADSYGWPRTAMHIVFGLLVLGFVVTVILAWYHGERGAQRISGPELLLIALALVIGGGLLWHFAQAPSEVASIHGPNAAQHNPGPTSSTAATRAPVSAASASASVANTALLIAAQPIPAKSVAVLPFENLSTDKGNAYFADGMQDLILTKLADIGDLKVIARTSTMQYGSHPQNLTLVGKQLGVATILEGSVQKAGNQVLINVQLINAKTDSHIWAQSYTRTLTNIFGVEGEVAQKVADALKAKLTSTEARQVAALPTQNAQAYDAYLRGQYYGTHANSSLLAADFTAAIKSYAKAIALDPRFALAWAQMSENLSWQIHFNGAVVDVPVLAARAKAAADHALSLAPDMAQAHLAQGWYQYNVQHDLTSALATFDAALTLQPHNPQTLFAIAVINKRRGHMQAAIAWYQKAVALDPRNVRSLQELSMAQCDAREYAAAARTARRALAIDPSSLTAMFFLVGAYRYAGDLDQAGAALNAAPATVQASSEFDFIRAQLMLDRRNYVAARKLLAAMQPFSQVPASAIEIGRGDVEWYAGDRSHARQYYQRAETLIETALKQTPKDPFLHGELGWVYARLGRNQQALEQGALAIKLGSMSQDATVGMDALVRMTAIQAQVGRTADAIAGLDRLLALPVGQQISVPLLRLDPIWDPIRQDPRFQALLKKHSKVEQAPSATSARSAPNA